MVIDGHAHACGPFLSSESIDAYLDARGVDCVVLAAGELGSAKTYRMTDRTAKKPTADVVNDLRWLIRAVVTLTGAARQIPAGNEFVSALRAGNPRIRQYYWITGESVDELRRKRAAAGFDGLKIHQCWVRKEITSAWFAELAEFLMEFDLPLFIHLGVRSEVDTLIDFAAARPSLKIIVAHCFGLERFIARAADLSENVYFDISNNYFVSERRILAAVGTFGASRVLFGSDTPYGEDSLGRTLARVNGLPIAPEGKAAILGENLRRLLKIGS